MKIPGNPAVLYVPPGLGHVMPSNAFAPEKVWESRAVQFKSDIMMLPAGSVVLSDSGIAWRLGKDWYMAGCSDPFPADAVTLPAKVLHEPGASK